MNRLARVIRTEQSQVPAAELLNIKARELQAPVFGKGQRIGLALAQPAGEAEGAHNHEEHFHDESVRSFFIEEERPLDLKKLETWIGQLLNEHGEHIYRCKGVLQIQGQAKRVVVQGVQMLFDSAPDRFWEPAEKRLSQMVFIGRDLDEPAIRAAFAGCVAA